MNPAVSLVYSRQATSIFISCHYHAKSSLSNYLNKDFKKNIFYKRYELFLSGYQLYY